ncbi:nucleoside hydrolase [Halobacillus kuroshimensis]|uniref:Nucleoside hydrolase n=1 Tax=Halobacillus kuroshimensis TaxID=302481 RepID=A0ABS3E0M2_9BACI|nr:nucleoside hydrolase [Halobacillus kuroshimensis]MBN8237121.1 nucleoside hydrolase [Halobacillus kuroshimensis]
MKRKVILDCDPGHDDAISIILAASQISPLQIEAITTVAGNVEVEKCTYNALNVCEMIGLDVPVAEGAAKPLKGGPVTAGDFHGESGLDGPELPTIPTKGPVEQHAVDLIIEKALQTEQKITLVPTGPLTNIASALIKEPGIKKNIEEIVLMGGGTFGNWTPAAEFNIWVDAEAAKHVFESGIPITMFGLDVTHQALADRKIMDMVAAVDHPVAQFVFELLEFFSKTYKDVFNFEAGPIHDACTAMYLIEPDIFECRHVHVDVETSGEYTTGMTSVDLLGVTKKEPNVHFAVDLDKEKFWNVFEKALRSYVD